METKQAKVYGKNREFKILGYKFFITDQENKNIDFKYCIDMYDIEKRYYKTVAYSNTIEEGKINALKYLANIL